MTQLLLIEDDPDLNETLKDLLLGALYEVDSVHDAEEGLKHLAKKSYDLVISDVKMPGINGYDFLKTLRGKDAQTPVLLMTAFGTIEQAVNALKLGASDYLTKPIATDDFLEKVKLHALEMSQEVQPVMVSKQSQETFGLAARVAQTDAQVLIQGESGTGKEVLAQYIHQHSNRRDKPFVAINCAAIPDNMLEATLFGYEKGAFTGAYQSTPGKFEQANGGTLLLDEISEMPLNLQAKLLRVLQESEVERLGSKKLIQLDVRIIATTNKKLSKEVEAGHFREDLYYRLNVFPMTWLPLRERKEDILPLAEAIIKHQHGKNVLTEQAKEWLLNYAWPGNIRQLQNVMQRAMILAQDQAIDCQHLWVENNQSTKVHTTHDLNDNLTEQEYLCILETLKQTQGNRQQAAEMLGVSPRTLRYKMARMKKQGFEFPEGGRL